MSISHKCPQSAHSQKVVLGGTMEGEPSNMPACSGLALLGEGDCSGKMNADWLHSCLVIAVNHSGKAHGGGIGQSEIRG